MDEVRWIQGDQPTDKIFNDEHVTKDRGRASIQNKMNNFFCQI
jgi:hypothetical protein